MLAVHTQKQIKSMENKLNSIGEGTESNDMPLVICRQILQIHNKVLSGQHFIYKWCTPQFVQQNILGYQGNSDQTYLSQMLAEIVKENKISNEIKLEACAMLIQRLVFLFVFVCAVSRKSVPREKVSPSKSCPGTLFREFFFWEKVSQNSNAP